MKRWLDLTLVTLFGLGLALPMLGSLCSRQTGKFFDEGRILASFPERTDDLSRWHEYLLQVETYYGDHFGFREPLIAFDLMIKRVLFAEMGPNVLPGREGWLYLKRDCNIDTLNDCLGVTRFSPAQLKGRQARLEERRDRLAAQGIKYLYVIAPNKESVYPEYLPGWLKPSATNKVDQFVNHMRVHSTVPVLDLRPVLREARQHLPVFYKTDSHWNLPGALVASEAIITNQSNQIPGLVPLGLGEFEIKPVPETDGDLVRMAGERRVADLNSQVLIPKSNLPRLEFSSSGTNQIGWPQIWSIPVPENKEVTTIMNSQRTQRVLVFGDSFAVKLQPFLGFHFGQVIFSREHFSEAEVMKAKPDLVIEEVVERLLQ
jgi:hypothetical protein